MTTEYKENECIVITAFGCVTPIGNDCQSIKDSLINGTSGIKEINKFCCDNYITSHAGIPDEGNNTIKWPSRRRAPIGELFYINLAAEKLIAHPCFPRGYYSEERLGCILGVDEPAIDIQLCFEIFKDGDITTDKRKLFNLLSERMKISDCMNLDPPMALATVYKYARFSGHAICHMGLCSASLQALGMAMQAIKSGRIDAAIVGGTSAKVTPINLARLELLNAISTDINIAPEERSRPFDSRRSGFVLAEGSVLFLIEKLSEVKKRGDKALLSLLGYGSSLASQHIVAPHTESLEMELCMRRALKDARLSPEQIEVINAHGTSTILNDIHESIAINKVFGFHTNKIHVTANKSLHGHLIATAGAMEVLNVLIGMNEKFLPATVNLCQQDKSCNLNITKTTIKNDHAFVLKNSFGMGGLAASLVLGKPYDD